MSYSISTLLTRNLHDVFGEDDPARRRAAIDEIFTEDCVFYEPRGAYRGRDEIDRWRCAQPSARSLRSGGAMTPTSRSTPCGTLQTPLARRLLET
jgi:hypothetical protein